MSTSCRVFSVVQVYHSGMPRQRGDACGCRSHTKHHKVATDIGEVRWSSSIQPELRGLLQIRSRYDSQAVPSIECREGSCRWVERDTQDTMEARLHQRLWFCECVVHPHSVRICQSIQVRSATARAPANGRFSLSSDWPPSAPWHTTKIRSGHAVGATCLLGGIIDL